MFYTPKSNYSLPPNGYVQRSNREGAGLLQLEELNSRLHACMHGSEHLNATPTLKNL